MVHNQFFMSIDFMFFHLMCMHANFRMSHLGTLKFNLQTLVSELPTSPQTYDNNKKLIN